MNDTVNNNIGMNLCLPCVNSADITNARKLIEIYLLVNVYRLLNEQTEKRFP